MTDLTISEAYFLFALNEKGKLSGYESTKVVCLISAALYELSLQASISFAEKRIYLSKCTPDSEFLKPLYDHLREMESLTYHEIYSEYTSSISERHLNALTSALGKSLADKGLVTKAKVGFFGGRTFFVPHKNAVPSVAAEYSVDLLFQNPPSPEDCILWSLLEKSDCIPSFFSQEQIEEIHYKVMSELKTNEKLKQPIDFSNQLLTLVKKGKVSFEYY